MQYEDTCSPFVIEKSKLICQAVTIEINQYITAFDSNQRVFFPLSINFQSNQMNLLIQINLLSNK